VIEDIKRGCTNCKAETLTKFEVLQHRQIRVEEARPT
jgi:hypothetical protein